MTTYDAKVLADSLAPEHGKRLTTLQVTTPRIILAELNTHRMLARNSASSRAIPVEKRIQAVLDDPFVPDAFGANQRGMQAGETLSGAHADAARAVWLAARDKAVDAARALAGVGVHKQWANRLVEPFSWHVAIITATEWENFFNLRCNPAAQPEMRRTAEAMRDAMAASQPCQVSSQDHWHLPLWGFEGDVEWYFARVRSQREKTGNGDNTDQIKVSVGRCARVSYLTHAGIRDPDADVKLHDELLANGHMSPTEHQARPHPDPMHRSGNLIGWVQYRKTLVGETVFRSREER